MLHCSLAASPSPPGWSWGRKAKRRDRPGGEGLAARLATLWQQLLKQLLVLDCASYEGFLTSGNAFVTVTGTCKLQGQRSLISLQSVGRHELSCILFPALQAQLTDWHRHTQAYTLPPPLSSSDWAHVDCPKNREADSLDSEGGFKSLLCVPTGRGEWYKVNLLSLNE